MHDVPLHDQIKRFDCAISGYLPAPCELVGEGPEDDRALDQVAQFPHITGPVIAGEFQKGLLVQLQRGQPQRCRKLLNKQRRQFDNVFRTLTKRGHIDPDNIDAVV